MKNYKTLAGFNLVDATIIVASEQSETVRKKLVKLGASIDKIKTHITYDVFIVSGISAKALSEFDKNDKDTSYLHYAKFANEKHIVVLRTYDNSHKNKFIDYATVSMFDVDDKDKIRSIATIYSEKEILAESPKGYGVNWGALGTQPTDVTIKFAKGLEIAANLANELTKLFVK